MHAKAVALSLAAAAVVRADLRINNNDIPQDCSAICRPVRDLGNICTVNFNFGQGNQNSDQTQDELDAQCVCTNTSFDLKNLGPQCNACMIEKVPQDQQRSLEGIQSIMSVCQLPSASGYVSSSTSVANTVVVLATRLTASSQLTTTIGGAQTPEPTRTRSSDRSTITTTFLTSGNGGLPSIATSTIVGGGRETGNAAPGLVAPGSNGLLGAVGAIVAGAFALGAFML
ncbi:protein CAP22 [Colletotrichum falcatum]|nr:protein CAP22 [Colletotrichum falcatum]